MLYHQLTTKIWWTKWKGENLYRSIVQDVFYTHTVSLTSKEIVFSVSSANALEN